jgi:ATP-dependent DNA ligase
MRTFGACHSSTARSGWQGSWAGAGSAFLSDHTGDDGAASFRHACRMGLEGIVSKRLTAPYRSGPSGDWLKVKNSPAMICAREAGRRLCRNPSQQVGC